MGDDSSIGGGLKNIIEGTVDQIVAIPKDIAQGAIDQLKPAQSPEAIEAERQEKMKVHIGIQAANAEIAQIIAQNQQKSGPEVITSQEQSQLATQQKTEKKMDEASRQAVGRAEQGRNFKG
jgi:hypothetical protein